MEKCFLSVEMCKYNRYSLTALRPSVIKLLSCKFVTSQVKSSNKKFFIIFAVTKSHGLLNA